MIDVPVYNMNGEQTGSMQIDEEILGGQVRISLLKQAVVAWRANQRQGSARTKSRGMVEGSTRKLYRQKGTGNARAGNVRTCIRRGGGVAFAKHERSYRLDLPKKMRRLARNSALLAKLQSQDVAIIDDLGFETPKTKPFFSMLKALGAAQGCVLAIHQPDQVVFKSGRNIPKTEVRQVHELSAYEILRRRKLLFTRPAFERVLADPQKYQATEAQRA
ncbi:MAG: 50S ribosomal protein L4 [Phycisphaerales bacterium]|nr:50S ribosomal protein L4 [Phycisphaerales bacterium]